MINNYIVLDLEMTGLKVKQDKILEIGAVKIKNNEIVDTFHCLLNPHQELDEKIISLTNITEEMAKNGREENEVINEIICFCEELPIVGHNILFDYSFLKQCAVNNNIEFKPMGVDTLKISRKVLERLPKKSLDYLCEYYNISRENCHRALDDAIATYYLFEILKEKFLKNNLIIFKPRPLIFKIKKQGPITTKQKKYLKELINYHKIEFNGVIEYMTKSDASRMIDRLLSQYGRIHGK